MTIDARQDGRPNIFSYMDGSKFVRIEIDKDEDGKIDRWEYYNSGQGLEKVGISRLNDGIEDAWIFSAKDGAVSRIEVATKRDRVVYRTEFFESGKLARVEEDTDKDGKLDRWETYVGDQLATVSFDTSKSGKPTVTVDYRKPAP